MSNLCEITICDISGEHQSIATFRPESPFMPLHVRGRFDDHVWDRFDGVGKIATPESPIRCLVFATAHIVFHSDGETVYQFCVDLQPDTGPRFAGLIAAFYVRQLDRSRASNE